MQEEVVCGRVGEGGGGCGGVGNDGWRDEKVERVTPAEREGAGVVGGRGV